MDMHITSVPTRQSLTQAQLKARLIYDPDTGIFTRKIPTQRSAAGTKVGSDQRSGTSDLWYTKISVYNISYGAHRLAFLWMTGRFPKHKVDHIDNNGLNNKWSNLREATSSQNSMNSRTKVGVKGTPRGVFRSGKTTYAAQIRVNKEFIYLGVFNTIDEAHSAYLNAATKYHGEFARGHSLGSIEGEVCQPLHEIARDDVVYERACPGSCNGLEFSSPLRALISEF